MISGSELGVSVGVTLGVGVGVGVGNPTQLQSFFANPS